MAMPLNARSNESACGIFFNNGVVITGSSAGKLRHGSGDKDIKTIKEVLENDYRSKQRE